MTQILSRMIRWRIALFSIVLCTTASAQCYKLPKTVVDYTTCGSPIGGGSVLGDALGLMRGDTLRMKLPNNTRWLTMRLVEYVPDSGCKLPRKLVPDGFKCKN